MRSKHVILLLTVLLSQAKAIFYSSDLRVAWYLFSNEKRYLCNVVEDYSNILIFGIVFYFLAFDKADKITKEIAKFLFFLNVLDLIHLGLMDMQYFIIAKIALAYLVYKLWSKLKPSY
jgi:hypothetical protein